MAFADLDFIEEQSFWIFLSAAVAITPLGVYIVRKRGEINILSPIFYPLIYFGMTYVMPSIILRKAIIDRTALYIQTAGIAVYLIGVALGYMLFMRTPLSYRDEDGKGTLGAMEADKGLFRIFFILSFSLLVIYGVVSKVPFNLFGKMNVEDLRRTAEVGLGFIKEPGIFFFTFSGLWLLSADLLAYGHMRTKNIFSLCLMSGVIFVTTAHKDPALIIIVLGLGLYNRYRRKIRLAKIITIGLLIVAIIGVMNIARAGERVRFSSVVERSLVPHSATYVTNYLPIVRLVHLGILKLQRGDEYVQNMMIIVPRFLWKEKPVNYDYFLKREVLHLQFAGGGAPATSFGSLYLNFGMLGVLIGTCAMGLLYTFLYKVYLSTHDAILSILALYLLPQVLIPSTFLANIVLTLFYLVMMVFMKKVFLRPKTRGVECV